MDILIGQPKRGVVGGRACFVLEDGTVVPPRRARRHLCRYVMQDDRMMGTETVEEALRFAASLALLSTIPRDEGEADEADMRAADLDARALACPARSTRAEPEGTPRRRVGRLTRSTPNRRAKE